MKLTKKTLLCHVNTLTYTYVAMRKAGLNRCTVLKLLYIELLDKKFCKPFLSVQKQGS
jgi:hypothetical protein